MTRAMRLLVLNCEFPPLGGGAATATWHLLRELEDFPVEATLITASADATERREQFTQRCTVYHLPVGKRHVHYWTNRELASYALGATRRARELIRREGPFDVCHAFFTLPAGAVAWRLRKECPYVVSLRGSDVPGFSERYGLFHRLTKPLTRAIWMRAAAITANSDELKELALQTCRNMDVEVIGNGVDVEMYQGAGWRDEARTVLVVGRLIERKDVATLIRALALLGEEHPTLRLIVAGDGPLAGELRELAAQAATAGRVEFRGSVPREEMPALYREADIFVLTSSSEGMSNTMLEALASGLPVVASRQALSGIEAADARVVENGDVQGVAGAIRGLLRDAESRKRAAQASRAAAQRYSWKTTAELYHRLYMRVAEAGGAEGSS